jgi:hypothetical protein
MLSDEQLQDLERLAKVATPGPWSTDGERSEDDTYWVSGPEAVGPYDDTPLCAESRTPADAALVATMRNALPSLLAEVRAARLAQPVVEAAMAYYEADNAISEARSFGNSVKATIARDDTLDSLDVACAAYAKERDST